VPEAELRYSDLLPTGADGTPYRLITTEGVPEVEGAGRAASSLKVAPEVVSGPGIAGAGSRLSRGAGRRPGTGALLRPVADYEPAGPAVQHPDAVSWAVAVRQAVGSGGVLVQVWSWCR